PSGFQRSQLTLVTQIETAVSTKTGTNYALPFRPTKVGPVRRATCWTQPAVLLLIFACQSAAQPAVLSAPDFAHFVAKFNSLDSTHSELFIPNEKAWEWMVSNVPMLSCPDEQLEETYYFRWWTFRKHI